MPSRIVGHSAERHSREGTILLQGAKSLCDAHLVNISQSGILVQAPARFPQGSKIALHLPFNQHHNGRFLGEIVRCERVQDARYFYVGIKLINTKKGQGKAIRSLIETLPARKSKLSFATKTIIGLWILLALVFVIKLFLP